MSVPAVQPTATEREFGIDELFFSTTDPRGIITAGNSVFRRVAGYEEHELLGKPHNIIRHPDMPRAVFHLLWSYLQQGRSIAAYVKNMAKDGGYYWVLATVTPTEGGYLSVRFKPSSEYLAVIQSAYAALKQVEDTVEARGGDRKAAIAASVQHLGALLVAYGFEDYDGFMRAFLPAELASRDAAMGGPDTHHAIAQKTGDLRPDLQGLARIADAASGLGRYLEGLFRNLDAYVALNLKLGETSSFLTGLAVEARRSSLNAVIAAAHLETAGVALGVVASLMRERSDGIAGGIRLLGTEIEGTAAVLRDLAFRTSIARLQTEMTVRFARELLELGREGEVSRQDQLGVWSNVHALSSCIQADFDQFAAVAASLERITGQVRAVHDELRVMNVLQINGRVESARIGSAEGFQVLFNEIGSRLGEAAREIEELGTATAAVRLRRYNDSEARERLRDIVASAAQVEAAGDVRKAA